MYYSHYLKYMDDEIIFHIVHTYFIVLAAGPWGRVGLGAMSGIGPCRLQGRVDRGAVLVEGPCFQIFTW